MLAAKQLATIDQLTNGRIAINLVSGWFKGEFHAIGLLELETLKHFGLVQSSYLIDVGCGSGRLARRVRQFGRSGDESQMSPARRERQSRACA